MKVTEKQISNFWKKILKIENGCWEWQGSLTSYGYGKIHLRGCGDTENHGTHRLSWFLHYGEIPASMAILHKCDNPKCCNPEHLFLGTQLDNIQDRIKKGRSNYALLDKSKQLEISSKAKSKNAIEKRKSTMRMIEHQQGSKNSSYGSYWLTNGNESIKWRDSLGTFPNGFSRGRVIKK